MIAISAAAIGSQWQSERPCRALVDVKRRRVSRHAEPRKPELLEGERPSTPIRRTLSYRGAQARAFATLSRLPGPRVVSSISPPPFFGIGDISLSSLLTGGSLSPHPPPPAMQMVFPRKALRTRGEGRRDGADVDAATTNRKRGIINGRGDGGEQRPRLRKHGAGDLRASHRGKQGILVRTSP